MTKPHHHLLTVLIFLSVVLLYPKFAFSAESNVELEWEEVPNAKKYDLEIRSKKNIFNFTVKEPLWVGRLSPGFFKMRIRGSDKRGVPGEWSDFQEFTVFLDSPQIISPVSGTVIGTRSNDIHNVSFEWKKVFAGKRYILDVRGVDSTFHKQVELTDNHVSMDLPVATKFVATVKSANEVLTSNPEKESNVEFIVSSKKLSPPKIVQPDSLHIREIKWSKPEFTQGYSYILEKFDAQSQKYMVFEENAETRSEVMPFKKEWPGGNYRLSVKAIASYRPTSDPATLRFAVKDGDRSEKAEELARLRESIERLSGWFGITSLLVNSVEYQNLNYDMTGTQVAYEAIGHTLRVGVGYVTKKSPWGSYVAFENSALEVTGYGEIDYRMLELNSFFKMKPHDAGEFRQIAGIIYKELPDLTFSFSGNFSNYSKISAFGFRYGIEYWHALTPKVGIQANAHIFPLIAGDNTPNGEPFVPTTSVQTGFLLSYRFSKSLTGLGGYAYRTDKMEYKTRPSTFFPEPEAEKNSVTIKGHYFNFVLEYQL